MYHLFVLQAPHTGQIIALDTSWVILTKSSNLTVDDYLHFTIPSTLHTTHLHSICRCSVAKLCLTFSDLMNRYTPGFPVLYYHPEFAQTHVYWVSDAIQPSHSLSSPSLLALSLFKHQGLPSELTLRIRWPKYWSLSSSISASNETWGLLSFRIDWFDCLSVLGTLKSSPALAFYYCLLLLYVTSYTLHSP